MGYCLILHYAFVQIYYIILGVVFVGGKTSYESTKKYQNKVYDRIGVTLPKGTKEEINNRAEKLNISLNEYVRQAIFMRMEQESGENGR